MKPAFTFPKISSSLCDRHPWGRPGIEPPLCEVLADPLIEAIMRCDGVSPTSLQDIIVQAQQALSKRQGADVPIVPRYPC
jgi:hypothetical protein